MMTLSETWYDLFGLAGLFNPFALLIGGVSSQHVVCITSTATTSEP